MKTEVPPDAKRRGRLLNGNPPGDYMTAPRCGARTRRQTPCGGHAMPNGRCRLHGGLSTGPRTPEGLKRARRGNWKTGYYSAEQKAERIEARQMVRDFRTLFGSLDR